jgi:hypothetical protein
MNTPVNNEDKQNHDLQFLASTRFQIFIPGSKSCRKWLSF